MSKEQTGIYFPLFKHLSEEHDKVMIDSELDEIFKICQKINDNKYKNLKTKSGKDVIVFSTCRVTGRINGQFTNRNGIWEGTSWYKDGRWIKANESSMDLDF